MNNLSDTKNNANKLLLRSIGNTKHNFVVRRKFVQLIKTVCSAKTKKNRYMIPSIMFMSKLHFIIENYSQPVEQNSYNEVKRKSFWQQEQLPSYLFLHLHFIISITGFEAGSKRQQTRNYFCLFNVASKYC